MLIPVVPENGIDRAVRRRRYVLSVGPRFMSQTAMLCLLSLIAFL